MPCPGPTVISFSVIAGQGPVVAGEGRCRRRSRRTRRRCRRRGCRDPCSPADSRPAAGPAGSRQRRDRRRSCRRRSRSHRRPWRSAPRPGRAGVCRVPGRDGARAAEVGVRVVDSGVDDADLDALAGDPGLRQVSSTLVSCAAPALSSFLGISDEIFTTSDRAARDCSASVVARRPIPGTTLLTWKSCSAAGSTAFAAVTTESDTAAIADFCESAEPRASAAAMPLDRVSVEACRALRPLSSTNTCCTPRGARCRDPLNFVLAAEPTPSEPALSEGEMGTGTAARESAGSADDADAALVPVTTQPNRARLPVIAMASALRPVLVRADMCRPLPGQRGHPGPVVRSAGPSTSWFASMRRLAPRHVGATGGTLPQAV